MTIVWRANQPKWVQIANVIKGRIRDGTYVVDEPVASEHLIVQEFGVSRPTARKVLVRLREEGVVYAVRGLGTFARSPEEWEVAED
ncbi:GntR family transcriptional regulator [Streptosporangium amethystogenes]|uniref:GntR family transcriptional regulator n=1 Tax=Streptosporangium amethystogenes TaxID=2002 RepID=UPI00146FDFDF|nr:GntR family transcriptional regulator [Streptosporangium amethystogenes]